MLIQVVRSSCNVTLEDDEWEMKLTSSWSEFVTAVDDAVQRVALQTPLMMSTLEHKLQVVSADRLL